MNRKVFSILATGIVLFSSDLALAQQATKMWRVGIFHVGLDHVPPTLEPLRRELKGLGYEEGRNLHVDWRNLAHEEAAHGAAQEFKKNGVDLIVAYENQTVRAAQAATSEIPIVFFAVTDPVVEGFVKSLAHPGGNSIGFANRGELYSKEIELFQEIVPQLRRLLVLIDPHDPTTNRAFKEVHTTTAALKINLLERQASTQPDIEHVFRTTKPGEVDGVYVVSPNLRTKFSAVLTKLSLQNRLPFFAYRKEWVEQGALFSYAFLSLQDASQGAVYIDRILKGTKPGDLPVQQPTKFELVINLKTAKQIGLTIPPNVLTRADKVIR